jgi:hypothetical protein
VCVRVPVPLCLCLHVCVCLTMHLCMCAYVCMYVCMYVCKQVCGTWGNGTDGVQVDSITQLLQVLLRDRKGPQGTRAS